MTVAHGTRGDDTDGHLAWGEVIDGRYEVQRPLGRGGMGAVYLARDRELDRTVAVKVLAQRYVGRSEREERFSNEARYGGRLPSHANIAMTIDAGRMENGRPYIVMEYVEGPAINVVSIFEGEKLELHRLLALMRGVAEALGVMHRFGIVHRDLTPSNILVTTIEGRSVAKVIDFSHAAGDVRPLRVGDPGRLTGAHEIPGTPGYMPPEQVGCDPADPRMDVFSFGVVLWELLSGAPAFRHTEGDAYVQLQTSTPTAPPPLTLRRPDLPPALSELVEDCTHVQTARRPSASAVVLRLDEILQALGMMSVGAVASASVSGGVMPVSPADRAAQGAVSTADAPLGGQHVEMSGGARPNLVGAHRPRLSTTVIVGLCIIGVLIALALALAFIWQPWSGNGSHTGAAVTGPADGSAWERETNVANDPGPATTANPVPSGLLEALVSNTTGTSDGGDLEETEGGGDEPTPEVARPEPESRKPRASLAPVPKRRRNARRPRHPRAKPDVPAPEDCRHSRQAAQDAKRKYDWNGVLATTSRSACWSEADRKRLRVLAYLELGRYEACMDEGAGLTDPQIAKLVGKCEGAVE
ncbi:MAG: serine/threonine protein kinase [Deltaproteobacteria bacterium]|nr:serine/threonine protein kinase [Deltaproteobacteria bacterium]